MTIRLPMAVVWMVLFAVTLGVGAAAGAAGYRYGPYAALQTQLTTSLSTISVLSQRLETARQAQVAKQAELDEAKKQAAIQKQTIDSLRAQLSVTKSSLGTTQSQLQQTKRHVQRQSSLILTQERDIFVLRTCLRGVAVAMNYMIEEDYESTVDALKGVERECRAASRLM